MAGETLIDTQPAGTPENLPPPSPISFPRIATESGFSTSIEVEKIFSALAKAQGKIEQPLKTKMATVKGKTSGGVDYQYSYWYCDIVDVLNTCKQPYFENGLFVYQYPRIIEKTYDAWNGNSKIVKMGAMVYLTTMIGHESGQWICNVICAMSESFGPQALGSVITYLRRYGLQLAGGIAADEDEDGQEAQGTQSGGAAANASTKPEPQRTGPANGQTWDVEESVVDHKWAGLGGGRNRHSARLEKTGWVFTTDEKLGVKISREKDTGVPVRAKLRKVGRDIEVISCEGIPPSGAGVV